MVRISNEDGREAAARNWGRFALSAIPWALGMGASVWLGVYIGVHQINQQTSQEQRAAVAVGAEERPKSRITFDLSTAQTYCAGVTRADIDGPMLRLWATNDCHGPLTGMDWHYEMLSPNGTVLHASVTNQNSAYSECPMPRLPKDSAECVFGSSKYSELPIDDRVSTIRVWTIPYSK